MDNFNNEQTGKQDYAERMQRERDSLFALIDQTALQIAAKGNNLRLFLNVQARFDHYSTTNTLLILAQKWDSTRLGDFDSWKKEGLSVKRGEKSISILEPGKEYQREGGGTGQNYVIKKVFDVSQVHANDKNKAETKTLPKPIPTERQLLAALTSKAPVKISVVETLPNAANAITNPETGEIIVKKGVAFEETFGSLAIELATCEAQKISRAEAPFAGYCAGFIICSKYGIESQQFDFTNAPKMFEQNNAKSAKFRLSQIRETANAIIDRIERNLNAAAKSAENAAKTLGLPPKAERKDHDER